MSEESYIILQKENLKFPYGTILLELLVIGLLTVLIYSKESLLNIISASYLILVITLFNYNIIRIRKKQLRSKVIYNIIYSKNSYKMLKWAAFLIMLISFIGLRLFSENTIINLITAIILRISFFTVVSTFFVGIIRKTLTQENQDNPDH